MANFGKRPLAYVCYLCGQQYGSQSLHIHIPQCAVKWCQQHDKPQPPPPPSGLPERAEELPCGAAAIAAFNAAMMSGWQEAALDRCPHCNRTFRLEALAVHSKVCSADKPFKPLPAKASPACNSSRHENSNSMSSSNKQQMAKVAMPASTSKTAAAARQQPTTNRASGADNALQKGCCTTSNSNNVTGLEAASSGGRGGAEGRKPGGSSSSSMAGNSGATAASGSGTSVGGFAKRPKSYTCYLCGQQYGSHSLLIHVPQCQAKWEQQQQLQLPQERLPLPDPPAALAAMLTGMQPLPTGGTALQEFNDVAFDAYNRHALVPCKACGRTFRREALAHHAKHCTTDKPMKCSKCVFVGL